MPSAAHHYLIQCWPRCVRLLLQKSWLYFYLPVGIIGFINKQFHSGTDRWFSARLQYLQCDPTAYIKPSRYAHSNRKICHKTHKWSRDMIFIMALWHRSTVRNIQPLILWLMDSHDKGLARRAWVFSLLSVWTICWTNIRVTVDFTRQNGQVRSLQLSN